VACGGARTGDMAAFVACVSADVVFRCGARLYNLAHTDALPLALAGASLGLRQSGLLAFALIWLAHVGGDRALGYGLKVRLRLREARAPVRRREPAA
jgi:Domain of unknown function (DUF4260)